MRITKFGHACVRLETASGTLVFDPGMFTDPEAVDGADAILITHEHADHYTPALLERSSAPVFTIDAVAAKIRTESPAAAERLTVVAPGDTFTAAGFDVSVDGELHAVIHPEMPRFFNSGYRVTADNTTVFHPGDALDGPAQPVDVLLAPVSAPWARSSELIDFIRTVGAPKNLAIHDRVYSEAGGMIFDNHVNVLVPETQAYARLADGADL